MMLTLSIFIINLEKVHPKITHSFQNHIQYFSKYLNWPRKRLKLPSLSFRKNKNPEISDGMILLPDFIYNEKKNFNTF